MANDGTFFDVLIDRLVADVRREFEVSRNQETTPNVASPFDLEDGAKKPVAAFDDLVSKMIDLRSRMSSPAPLQTLKSDESRSRFDASQVEGLMAAATRKTAQPVFTDATAEIAFALVTKAGAKFYDADIGNDEISREALKRERRRVLLTLHPDRVPEADRARAHESFLNAAEAFSILAATTFTQRAA